MSSSAAPDSEPLLPSVHQVSEEVRAAAPDQTTALDLSGATSDAKKEPPPSSSETAAAAMGSESGSSSTLRFLFCAGGIFVCYFFYGILQERM